MQRVTTTVEARQIRVPAGVTERATADLPAGERREVSPGRDGTMHVLETVTWVDGVAESRVRTQEHVLTSPQARVVEVGTREAEPADEATFSDEDEDEDADSDQVQTGQASWYINGTGYTAAHRTLPKGTVVTVTNLANGASVQVTINDRGPYIDGRVIDLNQVAFDEIADLGDGVIDVRVSW